jgi:hypothetical protein
VAGALIIQKPQFATTALLGTQTGAESCRGGCFRLNAWLNLVRLVRRQTSHSIDCTTSVIANPIGNGVRVRVQHHKLPESSSTIDGAANQTAKLHVEWGKAQTTNDDAVRASEEPFRVREEAQQRRISHEPTAPNLPPSKRSSPCVNRMPFQLAVRLPGCLGRQVQRSHAVDVAVNVQHGTISERPFKHEVSIGCQDDIIGPVQPSLQLPHERPCRQLPCS